jgi:hypothetical protein
MHRPTLTDLSLGRPRVVRRPLEGVRAALGDAEDALADRDDRDVAGMVPVSRRRLPSIPSRTRCPTRIGAFHADDDRGARRRSSGVDQERIRFDVLERRLRGVDREGEESLADEIELGAFRR